jgi:hypothetical protein
MWIYRTSHVLVTFIVGYLLFTASRCDDGDPSEEAPVDDRPTFSFEYYAQGYLSAFPAGVNYLETKFNQANLRVGLRVGSQSLSLLPVELTESGADEYMESNWEIDPNTNRPRLNRHLFAVQGFVDELGNPVDTVGGRAYCLSTWDNWPAFVAVAHLAAVFDTMYTPSDRDKVITVITIHELTHLACTKIKDCRDAPSSHYSRTCVMTDFSPQRIGGAYYLGAKCGDELVPFSDDFCEYCRDYLKEAKKVVAH